jgi:hypothetical protein
MFNASPNEIAEVDDEVDLLRGALVLVDHPEDDAVRIGISRRDALGKELAAVAPGLAANWRNRRRFMIQTAEPSKTQRSKGRYEPWLARSSSRPFDDVRFQRPERGQQLALLPLAYLELVQRLHQILDHRIERAPADV